MSNPAEKTAQAANRGESDRPPLALIAGPTASGKSALALAIAEAARGTVINADASQVYADLCIVSARPDEGELMRAPHRLFGHIDGADACSTARWAAEAKAEVDAAHAAGRLPILAGGSGLYIRTLLDGIAPIPEIDSNIRAEIRSLPVARTYAALAQEDPAAASRLGPTDTTRIARALEVVRSTGTPIHQWQAERTGGIADRVRIIPIILLPPRGWLYERINQRFFTMLEQGAIEEVEELMNRNLAPDLPVMRAIGVPAIMANLRGEIDRGTMILEAQQATRRYAKRQYTWFQHQPPADWQRVEEELDYNKIDFLVRLFQ